MQRVLLVSVVLLVGCAASRQYFEPAERVQGQNLQGDKVAIYPLNVANGSFGEAKLWSSGAYKVEGDQTFVHVGLEVHNTGSVPVELRPGEVTLDVLTEGDGALKGLRPQDDRGRTFAPAAIGEDDLQFALPAGIGPGEVVALRLHWQLHAGEQTYAQRTPFIEELEPTYYGGAGWAYASCWPYGPYDCIYPYYPYPYGYGYGAVIVPHHFHGGHGQDSGSRTAVRPRR